MYDPSPLKVNVPLSVDRFFIKQVLQTENWTIETLKASTIFGWVSGTTVNRPTEIYDYILVEKDSFFRLYRFFRPDIEDLRRETGKPIPQIFVK